MEDDGQLALYEALAARLKETHARVRALDAPDSERASYTRRLLAVTAAAKHDPVAALRRLDALAAELDSRS
ncbi:hypothetical protein SRB5_23170 [Streptomyces sp. RB5]|uniref:Uncharacterized protein n=1 Tax=Streptomyces smaragdinus TaxID=2585196 RepID=A0A7K0CFE2_9ACTN|nr:hypothetical protein [Streptomyces smaragdinus]MQY12187.1 hypothetical protein [Streptomyces smaragdinus]